jgi:hypothetical protein
MPNPAGYPYCVECAWCSPDLGETPPPPPVCYNPKWADLVTGQVGTVSCESRRYGGACGVTGAGFVPKVTP